jgi:transposase
MPRLTAAPVDLSDEQREQLQAIVRKHTSGQQLVIRAHIVLLGAEGVSVHETARRLGVEQSWRQRWCAAPSGSAKERLSDLARPGTPATYTAEQVCAIVAIACERPEESARPITHWTQQEIADEAVQRGIVESISQRAVGHFLKRCQPTTPSRASLADSKAR